ncbi:MAG: hypothetical protein R3236_03145 [Phycisphaeraceae bacterium]|nr:hypothetical protein [Phycisphaeraceae bacterium]
MQVRPAEIVIIALLAIVLLSLAFLFYNQTLLREEIQTNHQAVQKIQDASVSLALRQNGTQQPSPTGLEPSDQKLTHQQPKPVPSVQHRQPKKSPPEAGSQDPGPDAQPEPVASSEPEATNQPAPQAQDTTADQGRASTETAQESDPIATAPYLPGKQSERSRPGRRASREKVEEAALADYGPTVEQIIKELYQGKYKAVLEKCSPEYATLVGEKIGEHMDKIRADHGMLKSVMGRRLHEVDTLDNQKIFRYTIDTDKGKIVLFTITLQADSKKIDGLFFRQVPLGG